MEPRKPMIFAALALAACSAETIPVQGDEGTCILDAPAKIVFALTSAEIPPPRSLELRNLGDGDCEIERVLLSDDSDPSFDVSFLPGTISVNGSLTAGVLLRTAIDGAKGTIQVWIKGQERPAEITVEVKIRDPAITFDPPSLDFGDQTIFCSRTQDVIVRSVDPHGVEVLALSFRGNNIEAFSARSNIPTILEPGAPLRVTIEFRPLIAGLHQVELIIETRTTNGDRGEFALQIQGNGLDRIPYVDRFMMPDLPQVDLLLVVDNGASMTEELAALGPNLEQLLRFLGEDTDWQIAVTTTDSSSTAPATRIVTAATTNPLQTLLERVPSASPDNPPSKGLEAALLATQAGSFVRNTAELAILIITDRDDVSPQAPEQYVDRLVALKNGRFSLSLAGGDVPDGCSGPGGTAIASARYLEAASKSGGAFMSICSELWADFLFGADTLPPTARFVLTHYPDASSIEVRVNGVVVPEIDAGGRPSWTHDENENEIIFSGFAAPSPGAIIDVSYTVMCLRE